MKKICLFVLALVMSGAVSGQLNPVSWSYAATKVNANEYDLVFTARIQAGWYVYSQYLESDEGPVRTSFSFDDNAKVALVGKNEEQGHKHEGFDDLFYMNVIKYSGETTFTQRVKIDSPTTISGHLEFMTCDSEKCLPPKEVAFHFDLQ